MRRQRQRNVKNLPLSDADKPLDEVLRGLIDLHRGRESYWGLRRGLIELVLPRLPQTDPEGDPED